MIWQFHHEYLPERNNNTNWKGYLHPHVPYNIIYNSQDMEITPMSIDGQREWQTYTHIQYNGILFNHKKKKILQFSTTWKGLCWVTNTVWSHLYVESKTNGKGT